MPGPTLDRLVLESLGTAVVVLDAALEVLDVNPAAEALLGISLNQARGQPLSRWLPRAPAYERLLTRVLREREPLTERDMRIELLDARVLDVDCSVTPLPDAAGASVVIELSPLSEQKRLSREQALVHQNETVHALLRGLAHEVRNPLAGLRGAAQLLERELAEPGLSEYTQVIIGEVDRLEGLLRRLLGPRSPPRLRPLNVHEVTERVFTLLSAEAPSAVSLARDYDPSIPELDADRELLTQAVLNVGRNALEAVGGAGRVGLRTRVHDQARIGARQHRLVIAIDVIDSGPGVPELLDQRIFYPMVTTRAEGNGLGLPIAQSLINQHGGLIEFARVGATTVFSILLPVGAVP